MSLKRTRIISCIGIFILCFLFHFVYELTPCTLTAIFFPVNESIWEHVKLIFTSIVFYGIIDYLVLNKFKIKFNNFFTALFISSITMVPIFLILYMPLFYKVGPKMYINIGVMSIAIIISQVIEYYILKKEKCELLNKTSFFLIIVSYIIFAYLSYNPPKERIFFDTQDEKYGINNYNIKS